MNFFVQNLNDKLAEIDKIHERPIFSILKADAKEDAKKRRKDKKPRRLSYEEKLNCDFHEMDNELIVCLNLGTVTEALKFYNEMDVVELYDLYSYKVSTDYTE